MIYNNSRRRYGFLSMMLALTAVLAIITMTACSSENDSMVEKIPEQPTKTEAKGVTVTVSARTADAQTRSVVDKSTGMRVLKFTAGDRLFIYGEKTDGYPYGFTTKLTGYLTVTDIAANGTSATFTGTLYTYDNGGNPKDYDFGDGDPLEMCEAKAYLFHKDMKEGLYTIDTYQEIKLNPDMMSASNADELMTTALPVSGNYTSGTGFALSCDCPIFNCTFKGLATSHDYTVTLYVGMVPHTFKFTSNERGIGTIAFASENNGEYTRYILINDGPNTVGVIELGKRDMTAKVYNLTRHLSASRFSVSDSKQVYFSLGNLQATYDGTSWTWHFAENQWDYIGEDAANTSLTQNEAGKINGTGTVDLFSWVGLSSPWEGAAQYGICETTLISDLHNYGLYSFEPLKSDWGKTMGEDHTWYGDGNAWRTLTKDEWVYLIDTRESGSTVKGTANARYTLATINTDGTAVNGLIVFPDGVTIANSEADSWGLINNFDWTKEEEGWSLATQCTTAQWADLATKGCVFLPAAGYRMNAYVRHAGSDGFYWSASPYTNGQSNPEKYATVMQFYSYRMYSSTAKERYTGCSVRLVNDVEQASENDNNL